MPGWERVIAHLDMDAFFAAVEQLDHPEWRGRMVIVGADPQEGHGRGVVATASYEARVHGVRSAMPISQAYRSCPDAIYVRPRLARYREVAHAVRDTLVRHADIVEPASIDEAYLDLTGATARRDDGDVVACARAVKDAVRAATGLTASVGVAPTKSCAKIASDRDKPDGLTVVAPEDVQAFLAPLPVRVIPGVGPKTTARLAAAGVATIGALAAQGEAWVRAEFGEHGAHAWRLARGIDPRPVAVGEGLAKSRSEEHTFLVDEADPSRVHRVVRGMVRDIVAELAAHGLLYRVVGLKIRTADFVTMTRAETLRYPTREAAPALRALAVQLAEFVDGKRRYRLVGVRMAGLERDVGQRTLEEYLAELGPAQGSLSQPPSWARAAATAPRPGQQRFGRDW